jgi:hypothetical protein
MCANATGCAAGRQGGHLHRGPVRRPPVWETFDSCVPIGGLLAGFIEAMHVFAGAVSSDRNRIASDGATIWLTTFDDRVLSFSG